MPAPQRIHELVAKFSEKLAYYQSADYNEEDLRHEFLNPLFAELGWDLEDRKGLGPRREVRYEKQTKAGAPDYGFYANNRVAFYVEAKNPSKNVCDDPAAAFQLRSYGWSARLTRCVLSDFEEFSVYDTTHRPKEGDAAKVGRIECIKYTELADKWDSIAALFGHDEVISGSLEKLRGKRAKGRQAVDDELLDDISDWRELLAKNIALRNETLTEEQVNRSVQDTLDRIIFLRVCEDRGLEPERHLHNAVEGEGAYPKLFKLFKRAEKRYDTTLFDLPTEPDFVIDDATLKSIVAELYLPKSPYKFDAIPADILGQVYEQFLGRVIRLTEGHHAKVEDKPEVRKAGGVYYTPTYIVDYIVAHTVGELVKDKTPKQIALLSVVDPACGSGSFLIDAYQYLMDWYLNWYSHNEPAKHEKAKRIHRDGDGVWHLSLAERTRILTAHIYGVDIDRQATEVAKLSLMLKALEDYQQLGLLEERILPDLSDNIKCGNSLIGTDYFSDNPDASPAERARVNAFDWDLEFPEIFKRGGFTAVVGNPPYVDSEWMSRTAPAERQYLSGNYESAEGNWDLYCVFSEKFLRLLNPFGRAGAIVPNKMLSADYASAIRRVIATQYTLVSLLDYSTVPVFSVAVYPIVYIVSRKTSVKKDQSVLVEEFGVFEENIVLKKSKQIDLKDFVSTSGDSWATLLGGAAKFVQRILESSTPLGELARVSGAATVSEAYELKKYLLELGEATAEHFEFINTGTVDRYTVNWGRKPTTYLKSRYQKPVILKKILEKDFSKRFNEARASKIIVAGMTKRLECVQDDGKVLAGKSTTIIWDATLDLRYLLSLLNSKLMTYMYRQMFKGLELAGGFMRIGPPQIRQLPIQLSKSQEYSPALSSLVEKVEALCSRLPETPEDSSEIAIQRQIDATDHEIDQLVYQLYGLTEEEIRIIEDATTNG